MPFRLVYTEFWNDPKVMEEMTPEDKYFYLYLLTNPCTNMIGIYRIVKKQMAFDLGYSIESINSLMERFINFHKLIIYNNDTKELCIVHYGKYNLNRGGKPMLDCIKKDLDNVSDKTLISRMTVHVKKLDIKQFIENYLSELNNDTLDDTSTTGGQNHKPKTINHNPKTIIQNNNNNQDNLSVVVHSNIDVFKHFEKCGFIVSAKLMEFIAADIEIYSAQWLMDAASESVKRGKMNNYKYVLGILQNWQTKGRETKESINNKQSNNEPKPLRFNNFEAREYDYDDLEKKLLGWDS